MNKLEKDLLSLIDGVYKSLIAARWDLTVKKRQLHEAHLKAESVQREWDWLFHALRRLAALPPPSASAFDVLLAEYAEKNQQLDACERQIRDQERVYFFPPPPPPPEARHGAAANVDAEGRSNVDLPF